MELMVYNQETKIKLYCEQCKVSEEMTLGDLGTTPKGYFILPVTLQCIKCLSVVAVEIPKEEISG